MHDLDCLIGQQFGSLERRESDWVMSFGPEVKLTIGCLWRLIENRRIRFTSADEAIGLASRPPLMPPPR